MNTNQNTNTTEQIFNLDILNELANTHRELMHNLNSLINNFETNKDIFDFVNEFVEKKNLKLAFPIGISINHIIAHDSYHENNLKKLKRGDFIKIDVGFIQDGNIIDSARTFVYKYDIGAELPKSITDSEIILNKIEEYIRKQIEENGCIQIQKISTLSNALITTMGYSTIDYLGGHTIEFGKVHGSHYILNTPLRLLPSEAKMFIDPDATIGEEEMFAIEIYIGEKKSSGKMIKSSTLPITHYQVDLDNVDFANLKLNGEALNVLNELKKETGGLVYPSYLNKKYNSKIISKLIELKLIIVHEPLEYVCSNPKEKIKYVQYEDCFLIRNGTLINLSKKNIT